MITVMIELILTNGLGFYWPGPLDQLTLKDGSVLLGEVSGREPIPQPGTPEHLTHFRTQLKLGNRDLTGVDFRWIEEDAIAARDYPSDALYVERREYGPFIGRAVKLTEGERELSSGSEAVAAALAPLVVKAARDRDTIRGLERDELGAVNYRIERARLEMRRLELEAESSSNPDTAEARGEIERETAELNCRRGFTDARHAARGER
jgi:phosphate transport system permease protein